MTLESFIAKITQGSAVSFQETISIISEHYDYTPTRFSNGLSHPVVSEAGQNEGSCKIFAFAKLHGLDDLTTLSLFGDYYRIDVIEHPEGQDHQNIRQFIKDGWDGIQFESDPLHLK